MLEYGKISELCEELRAAEAFYEQNPNDNAAKTNFEATTQKVESALVNSAVETILCELSQVDRSTDRVTVNVIIGVNWRPIDKGWKLFNMIELELIKRGELRPIKRFSPHTMNVDNDSLYCFNLTFGNYLSRMDEELPENIEKEAEGYAEWAKEFAWELSFKRPVNQYTIQKKVPVHLTNSALLYAFIKALREVNDGMRFSWWKVHPEGFIMVNLA